MKKITVALVGRPNVGKSTLFNRLSRSKKAIIHDSPGVTRDRKDADASLGPLEFTVIDTPGLEEAEEGKLEHRMMLQTMTAVQSADLVFLITDGRVGITPDDKFFAQKIRETGATCLLLVNKAERIAQLDKEFYKLGFGQPIAISAEHGDGMMTLCEEMLALLETNTLGHEDETESGDNNELGKSVQIAVVGRPNSGKSTFINAILNESRLLTGPEAGITRDSIEIEWQYKGRPIKLVDTAGMRKRANVQDTIEKFSTSASVHTIKFANTVILMLDATAPLEQQDLTIAQLIINEGRSLVIAVNKWDLIEDKDAFIDEFEYMLEKNLGQIKGVPYVTMSAINKQNIYKVIESCLKIYELWNRKIATSALNNWLQFALEQHQPPLAGNGKRVKIKFCNQAKIRPPHFKFFTNHPNELTEAYQRYLLNSLREAFKMPGVPIRLSFVKGDNPYK